MTIEQLRFNLESACNEKDTAMQELNNKQQEFYSKTDRFNNYFNSRIKYNVLVVISLIFTYAVHFFTFVMFLLYFAQFINNSNTVTDIVVFAVSSILGVLGLPLLFTKLIISISNISFKNKKIPKSVYNKNFIEKLISQSRSDCDEYLLWWFTAIDYLILFSTAVAIKNGIILCNLLSVVIAQIVFRFVVPLILENNKYQNIHYELYRLEKNFEEFNKKYATVKNEFDDKISNLEYELRCKTAEDDAEEEYKKLISSGKDNIDEIKFLANKGSISANFYVGKKMYDEHFEKFDVLTNAEKARHGKNAIKYLETAAKHNNSEAKIMMIILQAMYKTTDFGYIDWCKKLQHLRTMQNSKSLSPEYVDMCKKAIPIIVKYVDALEESAKKSNNNSYTIPKVAYCKCCNAGICTYKSNAACLAHCTYMDSPLLCFEAKRNNFIGFK
ncbi:MAG: hypothetical protein Q4B40_07375 [Clostridia bacterium]|nr:hypothetical protein [Clostridia bacterium]